MPLQSPFQVDGRFMIPRFSWGALKLIRTPGYQKIFLSLFLLYFFGMFNPEYPRFFLVIYVVIFWWVLLKSWENRGYFGIWICLIFLPLAKMKKWYACIEAEFFFLFFPFFFCYLGFKPIDWVEFVFAWISASSFFYWSADEFICSRKTRKNYI